MNISVAVCAITARITGTPGTTYALTGEWQIFSLFLFVAPEDNNGKLHYHQPTREGDLYLTLSACRLPGSQV